MSNIAFFCIPAHGHTNPTLGVVQELVAGGNRVRYYSYNCMEEKITAAGAEFVSCDGFDSQQKLTPAEAARLGSDLALSTRVLVDTTLALDEHIRTELAAFRPDCIVADSMAIWGRLAAQKLGVPFVSSTTTFAFNRHSAKVMKQSPKGLLGMLFALPRINCQLDRLRAAGYPVKNVLELISNDENTHTVVYTSPMFQPCAETFSERFCFVGPSVRPAAQQVEKTREKLVYLSMGTVNNDMLPLYRDTVAALAHSGWQVILSVGEQTDPQALGPLPAGITAHRQVDQIAVLQQADAFVSHCGMNSASESLYYGVPLVTLPQTPEQQGVANRVLQLGAGIRPASARGSDIRKALETLFADSSYREHAAAIGQDFRRCSGAKGAAQKILSLCK